jgi:hypothetical protein
MYHSLLLELIMVPEARLALVRLTFGKEREVFLIFLLALIMVPEARLALVRLTFNKECEGFLIFFDRLQIQKSPNFRRGLNVPFSTARVNNGTRGQT